MKRQRRQLTALEKKERRIALGVVMLTSLAIVALAAGAIWMTGVEGQTPSGQPGTGVLAVIPFKSLEPDPETGYFGVGMADSIISHIAAARGLTVRPLSEALAALEDGSTPIEAGRKLGAVAVMVGEYRQAENRFHVSVRLLDVRTGATLWEHALDSGVADLMQIERKVVEETIAAMLPGLPAQRDIGPASPATRDATAHYLYLLARGKVATWQSAPIHEAVELLEQAIRIDPDFAPAQAEMATASANMFLGGISSDSRWIDRALAAGRRAVFLADKDARAHFALGHALLVAGDPVESMRETLRALQLDPANASALMALASLVAGAGHPEPVRALRDAARQADSTIDLGWLEVWLAMIGGDFESKMIQLRRDVEGKRAAGLSPELPIMQLGFLSFEIGDTTGQVQCAAMLEEVSANKVYVDMLRLLALGRAGDKAGMQQLIEKHRDNYTRTWDYSDLIGRAFAGMGETEEALDWLELSVARGNYDVGTWERSEMLDNVRGQPRFQAALGVVRERTRAIVSLAEFAGYM